MAKKSAKFNTSFAFGANRKKKGSAFSPRTKNLRAAHGAAHRAGTHPRQTGAGGGS